MNILQVLAENRDQEGFEAFDKAGHKRRIGDVLVEAGIVDEEQREAALAEQKRVGHQHLGTILVKMGYTKEEIIARVLASQLRIPFVRLEEVSVDADVLTLVDRDLATRHLCIPLHATPDWLVLAMANPFDLIAIEDFERVTGRFIEPVGVTPSDVAEAIERVYGDI